VIRFHRRCLSLHLSRSIFRRHRFSVIPIFGSIFLPVLFTGFLDHEIKKLQTVENGIANIDSLVERYVCGRVDSSAGQIDFAVKSITFYKKTDLSNETSSYFTEVTVACDGKLNEPIDLRLGLQNGTVVDTSWTDSSGAFSISRIFELETSSAPEYAELDPHHKIQNDSNYSDNSLTVDESILPAIKWINRAFNFFQNILLSVGVVA